MKLITDIRSRLEAFQSDLASGKLMQGIIMDREAEIAAMNADAQLYEEGVNALGVSIASYRPYSPVTVAIKKAKGQPTNRVTLRDEGDFEASFYVVADLESFQIRASDWKAEKLALKYGDIFGLTQENREILKKDYILPALREELNRKLYE